MFVVERIYDNLTADEYREYMQKAEARIVQASNTEPNLIMSVIRDEIKNILSEEIGKGLRDDVTGEHRTSDKETIHTICFKAYYGNKGTKAVPKTLKALNTLKNTEAEVIQSEIVDNKCSWYVYKITTDQPNRHLPTIIYSNGGSSVYLYELKNVVDK